MAYGPFTAFALYCPVQSGSRILRDGQRVLLLAINHKLSAISHKLDDPQFPQHFLGVPSLQPARTDRPSWGSVELPRQSIHGQGTPMWGVEVHNLLVLVNSGARPSRPTV